MLWPCLLSALPSTPESIHGEASYSKEAEVLEITASDRSILHFQTFDIGKEERVHFIQPSKDSCVLNRIVGGKSSQILGKLDANGRVFLVNPEGIYFGPDSSVNVGSFIASSLNLRDEDFLAGNYRFLKEGNSSGSIICDGMISAENFVALLGPVVQNRGKIVADADKVVLGSGEKIVLDFTGDGLIQFSVEGALEKALIENYGSIAGRGVELTLRAARKAVQTVVNTDGMEMATAIEESNGVIRLVGESQIMADQVIVEGEAVDVRGAIASEGGTIEILGDRIELVEANLDVSGDRGGGTILLGGDYQGTGRRQAQFTSVDELSFVRADARMQGDGGKVIVWADDTTLFDGKIHARGGPLGGNGGFVETSGKEDLGIAVGYVDTSAPLGQFGMWLLDPNTITIATGGGATLVQCSAPNCNDNSNRTIAPATIAASATNVALCAQRNATSSITVTNPVTMNNAGVSLTLTAGSTNVGTINLNANITTRGAAIGLTGVTVVGANVTLDTTNAGGSSGGGNINFSNTVNGSGSRTLTCTGGTGGIVTFMGAVGGTTALASITATGATITQSSTARATGAISYTGTSEIDIGGNVTTSGGAITMTGPVILTNAPTFDSTNAGGTAAGATITFTNTVNGATSLTMRAGTGGNAVLSGAVGGTNALTNLSFTSANTIQVGSNITITGANPLTFPSPVSLTGASIVTSNGANINFNSALDGGQNLTLVAGGGSITFTGTVGGGARLGTLAVTSAANVTSNGITATAISQASGTGTTSFGVLNTNGGGGIVLTANAVTFTGNVTTTGGGPLTITNGGTLTINNGLSLSLAGAFTQNGVGSVSLGGAITTSDLNISFLRAVTLTSGIALSTGAVGVGDITFSSTLNGTQTLGLTAGTGNISFADIVGGSAPLSAVTINSASNATATTFSAASLTQSAGSGTSTFNGAVILSGALALTTSNVTIHQNVTSGSSAAVNVGGTFALTSGAVMSLDSTFTQSGTGSNQLSGSIATTNDTIQFAGAVVLTGTTQLNTGSGVGDITLSSEVQGPGALTLTAGTGNVSFGANSGTSTRLGALSIASSSGISMQAMTASSILGTSTGNITLSGALNTNSVAGVSFSGTAISLSGSMTTTNSGPVAFTNIGTLTLNSGVSIAASGGFSQSGGGGVSTGSTITAASISWTNAITLTADNSWSTQPAGGNIFVSGTVNGVNALTLSAGTGDITLSSAIGGGARLTSMTINSARNVTASDIKAGYISQLSGTGTSTFNGALNANSVSGISLIGTNVTIGATGSATTITAVGPISVQNSGIFTLASGGTINSSAGFTQAGGTGTVLLSGSITAAGLVSFTSPVTLSVTPSIDTSTAGAGISFLNTVDGVSAGSGALTLTSGVGNLLFQSAVGGTTRMGALSLSGAQVNLQAVTAASISSSATAASTLNGALNTNAVGGMSFQGTSISLAGSATTTASGPIAFINSGTLTINNGLALSSSGSFSQSGGGAVSIGASVTTSNTNLTFTNAITLTSAVALSTGSGAGNISVGGTVNGARDFSLTSGTGNITLSSAVGGTARLAAISFGTANDIHTGNITANSVTSSNSTGTFTLVGNIDTDSPSGIQVTGNNFSRTGNLTTTNGGPLIIYNMGTITGVVTNTTSIDGGYFQTGPGAIHLAGTITTVNTPISFAGSVTLSDSATLNTGSGAGAITFGNTLDGTQTLDLMAGVGNILFQQAVGNPAALGAVTIHSATNVTTSSTFAASSITASGTLETINLGGVVSTSGNISLSANAYSVLAGITTTAGGTLSFALTGSSALTIANGVSFNLDGAFAQTGTGSVSMGGNITTTNDDISFASPLNLTHDVALSTGAGAGNFTFSGGVNGNFALSLTAGTGNLVFNNAIGGITPLTGLTIVSGTNITTTRPITIAGAFTSSVSGTTTFNNTVKTTTASGMNLAGAAFNLNGSLSTTNSGPIAIANSGALAISASISSSGSFSQTNTGAVSLGADVTSVGNLSFHAAVNLATNSALNSGNGNIAFDSTINGGHELVLTAGSGNITFGGIIGGGIPLSNLNVISAAAVTASAAISAESMTQTAGSGLTWFKDTLSTTGIDGIFLTGTQFQFDNTVDTGSSNGDISISHTGLLTISSTASLTADGFFSESGGGGINLGGNVTATHAPMTWAGPILLTHDVTLDTHVGGGNLTLSNTVNGPFCLTLTAGTGTIFLNNPIGGFSTLNCLSATGSNIVQNGAITTTNTVAETGAIQLGGNITTSNNNVTLTGNVTRTNANNLTISTGSGNILITGSINGDVAGRNLTLSSTTGVTIGGTIGASVPLNNCSLNGNTISLQNIGTTGAAGVSGTLTLNAASSASFNGTNYFAGVQSYTAATNFSFIAGTATTIASSNKAITFTTGTIALGASTPLIVNSNGGNITLSDLTGNGLDLTVDANVGTLTYANIGTVVAPLNTVDLTAGTFSGTPANIHATTLNFNSPGVITINSSVSSPGVALIYNAPVIVTADNITFSTCNGGTGADITFNSTLDADNSTNRNISIDPCGHQVFFNAPIGGVTPPSSITIQPASNVQVNEGMAIGSFTQIGGTGTTILAGGVAASAAGGISIQTSAITASDTVSTVAGGPLVFNNSGTLTSTATYLLDGAFNQSGTGGVSIGGNIATMDDAISFHGAISLTAALDLNTVSSTGANITFDSTINQGQNLTLTAGSGIVTLTGDIGGGTRIGTLAINSGSVSTGAVTAAAIIQSAGSATFGGAVNANSSSGISLTGSQFTFNSTVTTTTLGPLTVANTGLLTLAGDCTIGATFSQVGSGLNRVASQITAKNGITFTTGVTLTGVSVFDTSQNQTPVHLASVDGNFDLTLKAGNAGGITVSGDIGSTTRIGALSIVSVDDFLARNIKAASISSTSITTQATMLSLDTTGNISMIGKAFDIQGTLTVGGSMTINNGGAFNLVAGSSSGIASFFNQSGSGNVSLAGTIATSNAAISFAGPVTLTGAATSLSSGGGSITFVNPVGGAQNLTLAAGSGNIEFQSTVGATGRLAVLHIQSAANVSYDSNVSASAIIQTNSSGTTTIGGAMNANTSTGISLKGTTITQNGTLTSTNLGPIAIINSGSLTIGANITADGGFSQSGGGGVLWQGTISTTGDTVSFANAVSLTGAAIATTAGGNITFSSAVNGNQNLTLTGGSGTISLGGDIGTGARLAAMTINSTGTLSTQAIKAAELTKNGATGTSTWGGTIDVSGPNGISVAGTSLNFLGNITTALGGFTFLNSGSSSLSGTTISLAGALSQAGTGQVTISSAITAGGAVNFSGPIITSGSPSISTASGSQPIQFLNTVNGSGNLTLASGASDITFTAAVGGTTRLGNLTISSARTLLTQAITASSVTQSTGSSSSTFNGAIDTNGSGGVQITSGAITFGSDVTASLGPIAIVNTGALTTATLKTISSAGSFSQSGGGGVSLGGTVRTTNSNLSFADAISLIGTTSLSTGSGAGNITLSSTVDGAQDFTLTAGAGNITFSTALGATMRLGAVTFVSGNLINIRDITATSITLTSCSDTFSLGTPLLTGNFNTNGSNGIQMAGNNFFLHGNLVTTNGGPFILTNSGSITGTGANITSISGPYIQNGTGPVNLAGTVTTSNQLISFSSPITLIADATLDTGSGTGAITLSNTVNGNFGLTLKSGVGNITLLSNIGSSAAIGAFEVTSCANFTSQAITGASISLDNVTGISTFNGALNTTGPSGIVLTGGAFNCNGNITASGLGGMTLTNSLASTFSPSIAISVGGPFSQLGSSVLNMGGSITTNNQAIGFQGQLALTGNLSLNSGSGAGDVTIGTELDGPYALTVAAGTGNFTCQAIVGDHAALTNFTVTSARDITLSAIGTSSAAGVTGSVNLTSTDLIAFNGFYYNAASQAYLTANDFDMQTGSRVTLISTGPITMTAGNIHLNSGTDLYVQTNGGNFSFSNLHGTTHENFIVDTGSGTINTGSIDTTLGINTVQIAAGNIFFGGKIEAVNTTFTATGSIANSGSPVDIQSTNTATFNALGGNVGSTSSPILVDTSNQIYTGSTYLAEFNGSSIDNTVHEVLTNPPCIIIFNGITLKDCGVRPPPPPTPPTPLEQIIALTGSRGFVSAESELSSFNLASDFFFLFYWLGENYFLSPHSHWIYSHQLQ